MFCRGIVGLLGVLVLLTGCSGGENTQSSATPPPPHTLAQQAYVKASNTENVGLGDSFGGNLALSGNTLVVGAPFEDSGAKGINGDDSDNGVIDSGAVYVLTRSGSNGGWGQQAYLKASNTGDSDGFGSQVALNGDTLVVGAPSEDSSAKGINGEQDNETAFNSGAAYVFTRTKGAWSQQAYVKASNTDARDGFGKSVALSGNTLVVGAPEEDSSAREINGAEDNDSFQDSGAVYVFVRDDSGGWTQEAYVKASNAEPGDAFGRRVALAGDTLVVGAPGKDASSGAVYVFTRANGIWKEQAYVKASNAQSGDEFGKSVALVGGTLVVGAPDEDSALSGVIIGSPGETETGNGAEDSGAVYVFTKTTNGSWTQQAYVKASNAQARDGFGDSVALADDILAVGAPFEDSNAKGINGTQDNNDAGDSGAVYLFNQRNGRWIQQAYVKASNAQADDHFGDKVSLTGKTLAVGAPFEDSGARGMNGNAEDNSAPQSGAVYVMQ